MSADDHGHGHGHDSHAGPEDIIPHGSWQDAFLALISFAVLAGFVYWGQGLQEVKLPEHHAGHTEHGQDLGAAEGSVNHSEESASQQETAAGHVEDSESGEPTAADEQKHAESESTTGAGGSAAPETPKEEPNPESQSAAH